MAVRLPQPGGDDGTWGDILNGFLSVTHDPNSGVLLSNTVGTAQLQDGSVTAGKLEGSVQTVLSSAAGKYTKPSGGIPGSDIANGAITSTQLDSPTNSLLAKANTAVQSVNTKLPSSGDVTLNLADIKDVQAGATNNQVLIYNSSTSKWVPGTASTTTVSDASTGTKGILAIGTGTDLGNTALNPQVTSTHLTAPLPLAQGGTGAASLTGLVIGNGTSAMTTVAAPSGTVVGTSDTQTLTNKSISGSQITSAVANATAATTATAANGLASATTTVAVNSATAPTAGQVLTASSGTAAAWATPASGFTDPTTTKGDLIVHGASTTRLPVGTADGQVLSVASGQVTGLAWSTLSATSVGLGNVTNSAQLTTSQLDTDTSLAANSDAKVASQKAVKAYVDANAVGSTPSANSTTQGKVKLAGDLGGTADSPTVTKIQGTSLSFGTPIDGQALTYNGGSGTSISFGSPRKVSYVIAASNSPTSEQARADIVLTTNQDVAAVINTAVTTNGYRRIELTEGVFTQTTALALSNSSGSPTLIDDFTLIGQPTKTVWLLMQNGNGPTIQGTRVNIGTARYPSSSPAGASTNGTATFSANLTKGARTIALAEDLTSQLAVGDLIGIASTEAFNTNRTDQFFKGEFARVQAITSSLLTLETALRDSYIASQAYIDKYITIKRTTLKGITFRGNASTTTSPQAVRVQWAENVLFDRCQVDTGATIQQGLAAYTCLGVTFRRCFVQDVYDVNASSGSYQGYGMYTAGCENVLNDHPRGLRCRHMQDDGGFNNYLVGRHIRVVGGRSEHTMAAGFSNHNVEHSSFENCYAISCGGGFALRGTKNRVIGCRVYGSHSEIGPYSATQSTAHGIIVGEPDRDASSTYQITSLGPCGIELVVDDFIFDATNLNGNTGTLTSLAHGIYAYDPLINANFSNVRITPSGGGLYFIGDYNTNVTIRDYIFDGTYGFSTSSGPRNAIRFEGPGDSVGTNASSDIVIENIVIKKCRDTAVYFAGGSASNLAPDRVSIRDAKVLALGTGTTSTTAQFTIGQGSYGAPNLSSGANARATLSGTYYFGKATLANVRFTTTTKAAAYSNGSSGSTVVLDDIIYIDGNDGYQGGTVNVTGNYYIPPTKPVAGEFKLPMMAGISTGTPSASDQNVLFLTRYEGFAQAFSAVGISITSAISGGTGFQVVVAAYADDGTGSRPALAAPLQVLGTFTDFTNTTSLKTQTVAWTEPSGPYWIGQVIQYTGVPTTFPTWNILQNNILLPNTALNSQNRNWKQTGVSGTPGTLSSLGADGTSRLLVGLKV